MAARKCVIGLLLCASVSALASETVRTSLRGLPLISEHRAKAGAQSCKAPGQSCVGMSGNENQMDVLRGGVQADEAMFTLHYRLRGWTKAYAHLSLDEGKTWTDKVTHHVRAHNVCLHVPSIYFLLCAGQIRVDSIQGDTYSVGLAI